MYQGMCHIRPMKAYSQMRVYIIIFRQVLCTYFASLSSGLPILEHVFPREYSLNGYVPLNKVFLDQKHFKDCDGW